MIGRASVLVRGGSLAVVYALHWRKMVFVTVCFSSLLTIAFGTLSTNRSRSSFSLCKAAFCTFHRCLMFAFLFCSLFSPPVPQWHDNLPSYRNDHQR